MQPTQNRRKFLRRFCIMITITIKRNIAKLTKSGFLERKGGKRYGYWEVVDSIE